MAAGIAVHSEPQTSEPLPSTLDIESPYTSLALQVRHNLQYQNYWKSLTVHTHSSLNPSQLLPRPILSGLPVSQLYIHPDDQAEQLKEEAERQRIVKQQENSSKLPEVSENEPGHDIDITGEQPANGTDTAKEKRVEREWVLPTQLREKWSIAKLAEIFDAIGEEPPAPDLDECTGSESLSGSIPLKNSSTDAKEAVNSELASKKPRRGGKRLLLAVVSEDSAVSYYVVHDGIVKPRQN